MQGQGEVGSWTGERVTKVELAAVNPNLQQGRKYRIPTQDSTPCGFSRSMSVLFSDSNWNGCEPQYPVWAHKLLAVLMPGPPLV